MSLLQLPLDLLARILVTVLETPVQRPTYSAFNGVAAGAFQAASATKLLTVCRKFKEAVNTPSFWQTSRVELSPPSRGPIFPDPAVCSWVSRLREELYDRATIFQPHLTNLVELVVSTSRRYLSRA